MRVMRVIAGNVSYYVRKVSETKIVIGLKNTPQYPAYPAYLSKLILPLETQRYSLVLLHTGRSDRGLPLGCGFPA
jgi:hypothetical protein